MVFNYSIRVSRSLQKMTSDGSTVKSALIQRYEFNNVFDFFIHLDGFRHDQDLGKLKIRVVRVNSSCLIWSSVTNLPLGMSYLQYLKWEKTLLSEYRLED